MPHQTEHGFRRLSKMGFSPGLPASSAPWEISYLPHMVGLDYTTITEDNDEVVLEKKSGPRCLWSYLYRSAFVLAHHPNAKEISTEDFVLKTNDCISCFQHIRGDMLDLSVVLRREVNNAVEQVSLSLYPLSHVCDVQ